jgi:hypothetical protein
MSKAMAMECRGQVFVMTMTKLDKDEKVPTDGIWWEVEFPTLIDPNRPPEKKVDMVSIIPALIIEFQEGSSALTFSVDHLPSSAIQNRQGNKSTEKCIPRKEKTPSY